METGLRVQIVDDPMTRSKKLYIYRKIVGGAMFYNFSNDMKVVETTIINNNGSVEDKPSFILDEEMFAALVNAVHKDYKPSEGKYTEGELDATKKHLQDMRDLVFKKVK